MKRSVEMVCAREGCDKTFSKSGKSVRKYCHRSCSNLVREEYSKAYNLMIRERNNANNKNTVVIG